MSSNYERKVAASRRNLDLTRGGGMGYNYYCGIPEVNSNYNSRAAMSMDEVAKQRQEMKRHAENQVYVYRTKNPNDRPYNINK
jgi:hypothetical protein